MCINSAVTEATAGIGQPQSPCSWNLADAGTWVQQKQSQTESAAHMPQPPLKFCP